MEDGGRKRGSEAVRPTRRRLLLEENGGLDSMVKVSGEWLAEPLDR